MFIYIYMQMQYGTEKHLLLNGCMILLSLLQRTEILGFGCIVFVLSRP